MAHPIRMPKPGQMTEECMLVAWHKNEGDEVRKGDVLFEIETDKSIMDVESFDDGVLLKRLVEEGQTVPVNTVCAYVGEPGEPIPDEATGPAPAAEPSAPAAMTPAPAAATPTDAPTAASRLAISPRASRLAAEMGIDPREIVGSGPDGRIVERDVQASVAAGGPPAAQALAAPTTPIPATPTPIPATPTPIPATPTPIPATTLVASVEGEDEPRPLSRMRRVIAERLTGAPSATRSTARQRVCGDELQSAVGRTQPAIPVQRLVQPF